MDRRFRARGGRLPIARPRAPELRTDARAGLSRKPWSRRIWYPAVRLSQVAAAARAADRMIVLNSADRDYVVRRGWKSAATVDVIPHGVSGQFLGPITLELPRGKGAL